MRVIIGSILGLALVVSLAPVAGAQSGRTFVVDDPAGRNTVTFKSLAPLEDIIGTSNQLSGSLVFDPAHPEQGGSGQISVPVTSLRTGIPMRDEHLTGEAWLNAAAHPDITFVISGVSNIKSVKKGEGSETFDLTVNGDFTVNGISKRLSVPVRLTYLAESEKTKARQAGDLLAARASFSIKLADHGISGPAGMDLIGSKIGETIDIELSLVAASENK